jgi:hypothetical protein
MEEQRIRIRKEENKSLKDLLKETEQAVNQDNYCVGFEFESEPISEEQIDEDVVAVRLYGKSYDLLEDYEQRRVDYYINEYTDEDDY